MRHRIAFALLSAAIIPAYATTPTEVVAAFHHSLASGNTAQAIALLSPKVQIYESGHVEHSRDEYAGHHLPADMQYAKATSTTVVRQDERIADNMAVVLRETQTKGSFQGRAVDQVGTETVILEREADGWVITHVHWSSRKGK